MASTAASGLGDRPLVVCLLPVRNGARDLPGFLSSVAEACDAVVALDDGSLDATREILDGSPLIARVLTNPPRDGYAGWDDGLNRNRLLAAAAALRPRWIVSLDADERIDADDAAALRRFLRDDAIPGCAFGFEHYRMWGDDQHDPRPTWIYRLFAHRPGQRFPAQRLHFDPIPTDIPRHAWMRTTIRVRHLGSMTEERRLAAVAKYREADPDDEFTADFGGLHSAPPPGLRPWRPRPRDLPVLAPTNTLRRREHTAAEPGTPSRLVCLLPARNCEEDLPGYLDSVSRFADAVVALDDGSTDRTLEVLRSSPLVERLLTNPRREGHADWQEAIDRNRLLTAAEALAPDWILSLDADERLDEADGAALRSFVDGDALPGLAYGFDVYPMIDGVDHYDAGRRERHPLHVYRLFAYEPGQRFPDTRLHAVPIPLSIARDRWMPTTLRIQHLAGMTEARRRARFAKYREADPGCVYQSDYRHLLDPPAKVARWRSRPPELPVLGRAGQAGEEAALDALDLDAPAISAVVISRDDENVIERAVAALLEQECPVPFEVIVVTSGTDRTADIVRARFPEVTLVSLPEPALPGKARNAGLQAARGDYITFPGSHIKLEPGSLAARVRAHEQGYPLVTGTTLNGTRTLAGWASYFFDHSSVLARRPSGELGGPPAHCSYLREHLVAVGGFPEDMRAGEDTVVNIELRSRGYRAFRAQDVRMTHHSPCVTARGLVRHHFERGRGHGRILLGRSGGTPPSRTAFGRQVLASQASRVVLAAGNVRRWGTPGEKARFAIALPLVAAGAVATCAGAWHEIRRATRPSRSAGAFRSLEPAPN